MIAVFCWHECIDLMNFTTSAFTFVSRGRRKPHAPFIQLFILCISITLVLASEAVSDVLRSNSVVEEPGNAQDQAEWVNWPAYGGAPGGGQYSALDQVNITNVHDLEVAWTYHTGDLPDGSADIDPTTFEANPILANDLLYFCTPFNRIIALNPASGQEIWSFNPDVDLANSRLGVHICRGVSYWSGTDAEPAALCQQRIFTGTGDGRVIALDATNGARCHTFGDDGEVSLHAFDSQGKGAAGITSPPVVFKDLVVVGGAIPSYEESDALHGIVRALDARTGRQVWEWNPIPEPLRAQVGGVNVWAPISIDVKRGLVILATSSPTPDPYGGQRTIPIPYANAVVALNAANGEVVWHFQAVHHDLLDYDLPAQPILNNLQVNGGAIPIVIQITKTGDTFVLHRSDGKSLFQIEERPVPTSDIPGEISALTQPFPTLPEPFARQQLKPEDAWGLTFWDRKRCQESIAALRNEGLFTPPSFQGSVQIPNLSGGGNWGGGAFDPGSNSLIVNATNIAYSTRLYRRNEFNFERKLDLHTHVGDMVDTPYVWHSAPILSPIGMPCTPPPWGTLTRIDLGTGKLVWQVPLGQVSVGPFKTLRAWGSPNVGGPIVTAGGLVFIAATMDSKLRAYELASGKVLWSTKLPVPGMATPMTYEAGNPRRQYIVIAAGGHAAMGTRLGDALIAFALP